MKLKKAAYKLLSVVTSALFLCALNVHAQTAPTISTQPSNQTAPPGTNVSFSVTVAGTGPFTYQWQFNGTNLPNNIITTVAGGGSGGDGGSATNASLAGPTSIAFDGTGNFYISDTGHQRIRKVDTNGFVTSVAGNGNAAYSGDGGAATNASLNLFDPSGLALDAAGNLYIADTFNERVRRVDTNGIITTAAGDGNFGYSGDGGMATNATLYHPSGVALDAAGNLYIADQLNQRIRMVDTNGVMTTMAGNGSGGYSGDGGAATNSSLNNPISVTLDAFRNLYIADNGGSRVQRVNTNSIITSVAGSGTVGFSGDGGAATSASLNHPNGVDVDVSGNLYIADQFNQRIRVVTTNGIITTLAGNGSGKYAGDGGAATSANLNEPEGVASDALGNLYIADTLNNRIREVHLAGYPTLTLSNIGATSAGSYTAVITSPYGSATSAVATLIVQAPPVIIVQPISQIAVVGSNSLFSVAVAGSGPFGYLWYFAGTNLVQNSTNSVLALSDVLTNDDGNYMVAVTNSYGSVTSQVATLTVGFPPSVTNQSANLTVFAGTNVTFSISSGGTGPFSYQWQFDGTNIPNNIITTVAGDGRATYAGDNGMATNAGLSYPTGVALDAAGNLFIADTSNNRVRKVDTNGIITTVAGNGSASPAGDGGAATNASLHYPWDLVLDSAGNLYIADTYNSRIRKVDVNGIITTVAGNGTATFAGDGGAATNASLNFPYGVALDTAGNLCISDGNNNRIRKVGPNGIIITVAGGGSYGGNGGDGGAATSAGLNNPSQIAFDSLGDLYIADSSDNRIRRMGTDGIITTVAGNGGQGFAGDGGVATNANFSYPTGVVLDAASNIYIIDYRNNRVRKVTTNGMVSTIAGGGTAYPGNGGVATNANLGSPQRVALDASGNLYFGDTKGNRIHEVHFSGYPTFTLTGVSTNNSGNYTVIITSPYGSVTSAIATLTVTIPSTPPQIVANDASFGFLTNQFGFNVSGAFGQTIVVDGSTDLVNWAPLFTNTSSGNPFYFFDPASTNFPWRFYRARLP